MIDRRSVTTALRTLIVTATGAPCGLGRVPVDDGQPVPPPYTILVPITARTFSGAFLADESEDATMVYQVTGVSGPDPNVPDSLGGLEQAEWLIDKTRRAILGRDPGTGQWVNALTVPGASNTDRSVDVEPGSPGGTDSASDAIMTSVIRFRLGWTTTA